jgi:hypothetical protein
LWLEGVEVQDPELGKEPQNVRLMLDMERVVDLDTQPLEL